MKYQKIIARRWDATNMQQQTILGTQRRFRCYLGHTEEVYTHLAMIWRVSPKSIWRIWSQMIAMDYVTAAQCIAHFKHNHKALYQQRLCRLLQIKECYAVGPQIDDVFTRRHMQEEKPQAISGVAFGRWRCCCGEFFGIYIEFSTKPSCLSVVFIFPYVVVILPSVVIICWSVISSDILKKTQGLAVQSRDATKFLSHMMK